jgi:hypothetical protein
MNDALKPPILKPAAALSPEMVAKFQAEAEAGPVVYPAPVLDAPPASTKKEEPQTEEEAARVAFAKLPPMERWKINIGNAKLTETQANEIIDALLDPGFHTETLVRMGGRLTVVLKTRDGAHRDRLRLALDQLQNPTRMTQQETTQRVNLTDSLLKLHLGKRTITFEYPSRGDDIPRVEALYQQRRGQLDEIDENVLDVLYQLLGEFDFRVMASTSEGAVEGF